MAERVGLPRSQKRRRRAEWGSARGSAGMDHSKDRPNMTETDARESIRAYFLEDPSRMTMMAARKFEVSERDVVDALVGQWPIVKLRDGCFRELMDELPALGTMRVFVRSRAAVIESVGVFGG